MAAAQGLYAETLTALTATTTFVDAASIADTSFTASKKYLILATAFIEHTSATVNAEIELVHGTGPTVFTDAFCTVDVQGGNSGFMLAWLAVFDQPATRETVRLRFASAGTGTVTCQMSQIFALKLADDFTENTDWFLNEVTTDLAVPDSTTYVDGASVTFTPNGTDDWWVAGQWAQKGGSTTGRTMARLNRGGTDLLPECQVSTDDTTDDIKNLLLSRVYTPAASSQTFKLQFKLVGTETDSTVFSSRIFALNLEKFRQHFNEYTEAATSLANGSWTTVATESVTPDVTGDWFYMGTWIDDDPGDDSTRALNVRLQHDNSGALASDPAYGDDEPGVSYLVGTEEQPVAIFKMRSLTSGASRTVNVDGQNTTAALSDAKHRGLVGFSLELPGGGTTYTKAGGATAPFTASGADVDTAVETGTGISPFTGSGADVATSSETGAGITAFTGSGADVHTAAETGAGVIGFTGGGVGTLAGGTTYEKTGLAAAPFTGSGADVFEASETGAAVAPFTGGGTRAVTHERANLAVVPFTGSGADAHTAVETGTAILERVASGADAATLARAGAAILPFTGGGVSALNEITLEFTAATCDTATLTDASCDTGTLTAAASDTGTLIAA